jgi:hypothetical protein
MTDPDTFIRRVFVDAGEALADVFNRHGLDPELAAFCLILWPIGKPQHASSVVGSTNRAAGEESVLALAEAIRKAHDGATHVEHLPRSDRVQ